MEDRTRSGAAIGLALALLGGQAAATALGVEAWPFTCAPMFAHPLTLDQPTWRFAFRIVSPSGARELRLFDLGLSPMLYSRALFSQLYGSADPRSALRPPAGRGVADLEARLSPWMAGLMEVTQRRRPDLAAGASALELWLVPVDPPRGGEPHPLGRWDRTSGLYTHAAGAR